MLLHLPFPSTFTGVGTGLREPKIGVVIWNCTKLADNTTGTTIYLADFVEDLVVSPVVLNPFHISVQFKGVPVLTLNLGFRTLKVNT